MSQNNKVVVVVKPVDEQGEVAGRGEARKTRDYGVESREEAEKTPEECDPLLATPHFNALMVLLEQDGYDMSGPRDELTRLKSTASTGLTLHRSIARQVASAASSHVAILASRDDN